MKNFKLSLFLFVFITLSYSINAQIKVSKILQESKIVQTESNKLYFVDFWATWCGPCVYSKKILTVLQQQYPRDFHAISISEENPELVEHFLKKNPTLLTSVVDSEGSTFKKFKVKALPKGILFNAKGEKLWEGHPSDLKVNMISRFLRENKSRTSFSKFVKVIETNVSREKEYLPKSDIEIKANKNASEELAISYGTTFVKFEGSLIHILSYLSKINEQQILLDSAINKVYTIYIKTSKVANNNTGIELINKLGLSVIESSTSGEAMTLQVKNPNFWDTNQINWGDVASKYLVSDSDISADNVSLRDMAYQLSKALDIPVVISSSNDKHIYSIHDWQIHYKYYEFMQSNLEDYGIKIKKEKVNYPKYIITKKAP